MWFSCLHPIPAAFFGVRTQVPRATANQGTLPSIYHKWREFDSQISVIGDSLAVRKEVETWKYKTRRSKDVGYPNQGILRQDTRRRETRQLHPPFLKFLTL